MTRNARGASALAAAATLTAGLSISAQQAPQPVFRSGATIVEITVIVRDTRGAFVRGLGARDIEIVEDGTRRPVELMYLVEGPGPRDAAPAQTGTAAPESRRAPRTFLFAFDLAQMSPRSLTRARDAAVTFAKERLQRSDASGLAVMDSSAPGRISADHHELIAQMGRLKPRSDLAARERALREWPRILSYQEASEIASNVEQTLVRVRDRACTEREMDCVDATMRPGATTAAGGKAGGGFEQEANRDIIENELRSKAGAYVAETRASAARSAASLQTLAETLEAIRGRKTIIWFTEGTPILDVATQAREAAARAAGAGVAVYTIDPRGLQSRTGDVLDAAPDEVGLDFLKDTGDIPALMASGTGALFIRNENRLDRALARVEDDTSSYYVIGYAASDAGPRTRERRLSVRVTREGLSARVRTGFVAPQHTSHALGTPVPSTLTALPGTQWALAMPVSRAPQTADTPAAPADPAPANVARLRGLSPGDGTAGLASSGWRAYERGDLEAALPLFEKAAAMKDARPWALYALGFTYVGLGRPRDAITAWERVRSAAPDFTQVYLDLAAHYAQASDVTAALSVLRDAARRWPSNEAAHNGIGVLLVRRGALDDAIAAFSAATAAAPDDPVSWLNLGRAYELRYDRARRYDEQRLRWVGPEGERRKAAHSYERCAQLGGPYAQQATEALARVNWSQ